MKGIATFTQPCCFVLKMISMAYLLYLFCFAWSVFHSQGVSTSCQEDVRPTKQIHRRKWRGEGELRAFARFLPPSMATLHAIIGVGVGASSTASDDPNIRVGARRPARVGAVTTGERHGSASRDLSPRR